MKTGLRGHVGQYLTELVLGTLDPKALVRVQAHLAGCPSCRRAAEKLSAATRALSSSLPAAEPGPDVLGQVLARVEGKERFIEFTEQIAELFDISEARGKELLAKVVTREAWEPGPAPGIDIVPVEPGPKRAGAFSAFVRIPPGAVFPAHKHLGVELNLVLQGGFREGKHEVWRGDLAREPKGSSHEQVGLPGVDCIAASVLMGQMELVEAARPKRRRR